MLGEAKCECCDQGASLTVIYTFFYILFCRFFFLGGGRDESGGWDRVVRGKVEVVKHVVVMVVMVVVVVVVVVVLGLSLIHISEPTRPRTSRMPSSA